VATACFFEKPRPLRQKHPELYDELKRFYQQDPAEWLAAHYEQLGQPEAARPFAEEHARLKEGRMQKMEGWGGQRSEVRAQGPEVISSVKPPQSHINVTSKPLQSLLIAKGCIRDI